MRRRIRYGETWAGLGALALLGFMFMDWFSLESARASGISGWDALGWLALALCAIAFVAGLALPLVYARSESPALPELTAVLCGLFGSLAVIALLVQVIFQPGPDEIVSVESGWWLGLLATLAIARGGYLSMHDEYVPDLPLPDVEVRPAPVHLGSDPP